MAQVVTLDAKPSPISIDPATTAVIVARTRFGRRDCRGRRCLRTPISRREMNTIPI